MWREGTEGKWMAIFFSIVLITVVVGTGACTMWLYEEVTRCRVSSGEIIEKWYQPEHHQWTGKAFITVPPKWHVLIKGKGNCTEDYVVSEYTFFHFNQGDQISFK